MATATKERTNAEKQALPGRRGNFFWIRPEDLVLVTDPSHPLYDKRVNRPVRERLVRSIMRRGVKVAVKVRRNGDLLEVVDGRQRVKAALEANRRLRAEGAGDEELIEVKCEPEKGDGAEITEVMILLNEERTQDNPVERAQKMAALLERGRSREQVAELFDVSEKTIENYVGLLELAEQIQEAVARGECTMTKALALRGLPIAEQLRRFNAPVERSTVRRPGKKKVERLLAADGLKPELKAVVQWMRGEITDEEAAERIRGFGAALAPTS